MNRYLIGDDHWQACRHALGGGDAEVLGIGRQDEDVGVGQRGLFFVALQEPGPENVGGDAKQRGSCFKIGDEAWVPVSGDE